MYPCFCGTIPQLDQPTLSDLRYMDIVHWNWEKEKLDAKKRSIISSYRYFCPQCGYGYGFRRFKSEAAAREDWDESVQWEAIYSNGHCTEACLSDTDQIEIDRVKKLIEEEAKLCGYHPHKSCEVLGRYKNSEKYRLCTVFEHYGLADYTLFRNRFTK